MLTILVIVLRRSQCIRQEACQRVEADQTTPTPPNLGGEIKCLEAETYVRMTEYHDKLSERHPQRVRRR